MIIFRYIGYGLCCFSILILIYEILRYVETHIFSLVTVKQAWNRRHAGNLDGSAGESHFSGFLGEVISVLINMPLLSVVVLTGVFFIFLARHSEVDY